MSAYETLSQIDISEHVKRKGDFNYLSWPYAVDTLLKNYPHATWHVHEFPATTQSGLTHQVPFLKTELGFFVRVSVIIDGLARVQLHPVLDYRNNPLDKPTSFDINSALQRCLVKACALHGLGLNLYAGEDLPINVPAFTPDQQDSFLTYLEGDDPLKFYAFMQSQPEKTVTALFSAFPKGQKTKSKEKIRLMNEKANVIINEAVKQISSCIQNDDRAEIEALLEEIEEVKSIVWERLTEENQRMLRELLK